ncbi:hypothetical protein GCM10027064_11120 [Microbacterium petrolearium]|jgi:Tfp pilus assembly protein PilO
MMDRVRVTYLLGAILAIAILVVGFVVGIKPMLDQADAAAAEQARIAETNKALALRLAELRRTQSALEEHQADLDELRRELPSSSEYDVYIEQLDATAMTSGAGVALNRLTFGDAALAGGEGDEASAGADAADSAEDAAAAAVGAQAGVLLSVPVSIDVAGSGPDVRTFIDRLQHGDRYTLVTDVTMSAAGDRGDIMTAETTATIEGLIWILPQ